MKKILRNTRDVLAVVVAFGTVAAAYVGILMIPVLAIIVPLTVAVIVVLKVMGY